MTTSQLFPDKIPLQNFEITIDPTIPKHLTVEMRNLIHFITHQKREIAQVMFYQFLHSVIFALMEFTEKFEKHLHDDAIKHWWNFVDLQNYGKISEILVNDDIQVFDKREDTS